MILTIELISANTVKISLTGSDLLTYDILDCCQLDKNDPQTRHMISSLMEMIREEKDVDLSSEKLYIEAFPRANGGCLLYISVAGAFSTSGSRGSQSRMMEYICPFTNPENLLRAGEALSHLGTGLEHSSLYGQDDGRYCLILRAKSQMEKPIRYIFREFSAGEMNKGAIPAAAIREHWKPLAPKYAIERLTSFSACSQ